MASFEDLYKVVIDFDRRLKTLESVVQTKSLFVKEAWQGLYFNHFNEDRWTNSGSYVDLIETTGNIVDFDDWEDHEWYFEVVGKVDGDTGYWQLYNETTDAVVSGSEISTTSTSAIKIRTSAITKPSGENSFKIQHKIDPGGGSNYVNLIIGRFVFRV